MSIDQINLLFALLAFVSLAIGAGVIGAQLIGKGDRLAPIVGIAMPLALAIAVVATAGSLYYSGIEHYTPCRMCWWQRIFMYPMVPLLGLGVTRRDRNAAVYGSVLAAIGLAWSAWHLRTQWFPPETDSCSAEAPCSAKWVDTFGFVSIPFMAACGFIGIGALLITYLRSGQPGSEPHRIAETEAVA